MLRGVVTGLGIVLIGFAIIITFAAPTAWPAAVQSGLFGTIIVLSIVLEGRYRAARANGPVWQLTGERFIDPTTGKLTEVRYNPTTGQRSYTEVE